MHTAPESFFERPFSPSIGQHSLKSFVHTSAAASFLRFRKQLEGVGRGSKELMYTRLSTDVWLISRIRAIQGSGAMGNDIQALLIWISSEL